MKTAIAGLFATLLTLAALGGPALAQPAEKTDFVCPVFNENSAVGAHNPNAVEIGEGHYTIVGPNVNVPDHATNGDGAGSPPGPHSEPGDTDYTAIWNG